VQVQQAMNNTTILYTMIVIVLIQVLNTVTTIQEHVMQFDRRSFSVRGLCSDLELTPVRNWLLPDVL